MSPTKSEIKLWLKKRGHTREWLADQCGGVSKNTVNNWLSTSIDISSGNLTIIRRLMEDDEKASIDSQDTPSHNLVLKISEEQFRRWENAARKKNLSILDYSINALEEAAQAELASGAEDLEAASDKKKSGLRKIAESFNKEK